jgi:hypothetical protein
MWAPAALVGVLLLTFFLVSGARTQLLESGEIRLTPAEPVELAGFGRSIDIDEDTIVIGAPGEGAVFVFELVDGGWAQTARLEPVGLASGSQFGYSVAISGNQIAAGARLASTETGGNSAGAVYIFERQAGRWVEQARLTAIDGTPSAVFGHSLALDGDTLLVGARGAGLPPEQRNAGAAYIFHRSSQGWSEQARLSAPQPSRHDFFGHAVAIKGDLAAVSAPGVDDTEQGANSGAVYLFERHESIWYRSNPLPRPPTGPHTAFGGSLALGQDELVVGAYQEGMYPYIPYFQGTAGAAYYYDRQGGSWSQPERIAGDLGGEFGGITAWTVAIDRDEHGRALVALGTRYGWGMLAFIRDHSGWSQLDIPIPEPGFPDGYFHEIVLLHSETLLVGSPVNGVLVPDPAGVGMVSVQSGVVHLKDIREALP